MITRFFYSLDQLRLWHCLFLLVLLCLPALFSPFYSDDFFHQLLLQSALSDTPSVLNREMPGSFFGLYAFVDDVPAHILQLRQFSVLPWWADDDFWFRFWRPVAELSHALDYLLLPRQAWLAHLHSVFWFALLLFSFQQWLKRLSVYVPEEQRQRFIVLALLLLTIDGQHVATIAWVANRNALIACVFGLWCLIHLDKARGDKTVGNMVLSLLCLLFALLSAEAAITVTAFIFAQLYFLRGLGVKRLACYLLPFFCVSLAWMYCHQALGYGAEPSGNSYINPFSHPINFLLAMLERVPVYWLANVTSTPAGAFWTLGDVLDGFTNVYWLSAVVVWILISVITFRFYRRDKLMLFAYSSFLLGCVPASLANPQDRLALFITLPVALFSARVLLDLFARYQAGTASKKLRLALYFVMFTQLVMSPLHLFAGGLYMRYEAMMINQELTTFDAEASINAKNIVFLNLPLGYQVMFSGVRAFHHLALPDNSLYVGNDIGELKIEVLSLHDLRVSRQPSFATNFESYFRDIKANPFSVGECRYQAGANVCIAQLDEHGFPMVIMLRLDKPIDANEQQFYYWQQGKIKRIELELAKVYNF